MSQTVSRDLQDFAAELKAAKDEIATFALAGKPEPASAAAKRCEAIRGAAVKELDALGARIAAAPAGAEQDRAARRGIRQIWRIVGRHRELVDALDRQPFNIIEVNDADKNLVDFKIKVREVAIPSDAGALKAEIDTALTIVKSVMEDRKANLGIYNYIEKEKRLQSAQTEYIEQLIGIARVGLMTNEPSRIAFARGDLGRLKTMFTMREGGIVKNSYVMRLLFWSSSAAVIFACSYAAVRTWCIPPWTSDYSWGHLLFTTRNFHLMAAGTAIGTWLSFSLRRQELAFEDLAVLEPDRLEPSARMLYMIGLASLIGLLLFSGAVVAGIGTVTGLEGLREHGTWALLFGLLAGIAERGLGSAVERRSADFAAAIGGTDTAGKVKL